MDAITNNTAARIHTGRVATLRPRTYNTATGWVADLTNAEARRMRLPGYSTGRYAYTVDLSGTVERWANGFGGFVANVEPPAII